jgi:rRNA-processing protein FCF1
LQEAIKIRIFESNIRIMNTKLTLTVEKEIIEKAKSYAKSTGMSLSAIIEKYLDRLTMENNPNKTSDKLSNLLGSVKIPDDFDENNALREYFENKHK